MPDMLAFEYSRLRSSSTPWLICRRVYDEYYFRHGKTWVPMSRPIPVLALVQPCIEKPWKYKCRCFHLAQASSEFIGNRYSLEHWAFLKTRVSANMGNAINTHVSLALAVRSRLIIVAHEMGAHLSFKELTVYTTTRQTSPQLVLCA